MRKNGVHNFIFSQFNANQWNLGVKEPGSRKIRNYSNNAS